MAEDLITLQLLRHLSQFLAQLWVMVRFIVIGSFTLLLAINSYPFPLQHRIGFFLTILIAMASVVILRLVIGINRDETISRVGNTMAGFKIDHNLAVAMAGYILPLVGILAAVSYDMSICCGYGSTLCSASCTDPGRRLSGHHCFPHCVRDLGLRDVAIGPLTPPPKLITPLCSRYCVALRCQPWFVVFRLTTPLPMSCVRGCREDCGSNSRKRLIHVMARRDARQKIVRDDADPRRLIDGQHGRQELVLAASSAGRLSRGCQVNRRHIPVPP